MKRYANSAKSIGFNDFLHSYACFCFSLLAYSTSLKIANTLYRAICTIFLSKTVSAKVKHARHIIKAAILERPETLNKLKEILSEFKLNVYTLDLEFTDVNEEEELLENSDIDEESNTESNADEELKLVN